MAFGVWGGMGGWGGGGGDGLREVPLYRVGGEVV